MKTQIGLLAYSALASLIAVIAAPPVSAQVLELQPTVSPVPETSDRAATLVSPEESLAQDLPADLTDDAAASASLTVTDWESQLQLERHREAPPDESIAQAEAAVITDVRTSTTPEGLSITLVADQPLAAGPPEISGNALITDIPNATLALVDEEAAQQFSPTEGIALVQISELAGGGVRVSVTGTDAPPIAQVSAEAGGLVLSVVPGIATADADVSTDAIQVVVTATRTEEDILDIPRSVTVIDREELEQQLNFTTNLPDILGRLVPGLGAPPENDRTNLLRLRGRPITVLIDGVPQTPNNNSFATSLSTIDPSLVERIEVLRGPSAIYGDGGTGGIINIITRAPAETSVAYDLSLGGDLSLTSNQADVFGYGMRFGVSGSSERADGVLSVAYDVTNGQFNADGIRILPNGINDNDRIGLLAKVGFNLDEQQRLGFTYSFFRQLRNTDYRFDNSVIADPNADFGRALLIGEDGASYDDPPEQINHVLNMTYRHTDILGSQLDAQLYYRDTDEVGIFTDLSGLGLPAFFPELWQTSLQDEEYGGRLQIDTPLGDVFGVLWGVDYSRNETASPLLVSDPVAFAANQELNIIDRSLDRFPSYDLETLGLFAQGTWDITSQLQLSGGIRYENVDLSVDDYELAFRFPRERQGGTSSFDDVLFNVGLIYRPIPELGLFASFAQGFSIPDIGNSLQGVLPTFDVTDDLLLEPQKVDNFEAGIRADFNQLQATLSGFYNESELGSSISIDPATGFGVVNRAPQRNYGIEATVDWQPDTAWRLGGTFTWNEGENDVDDDGNFDALSSVEVQPVKLGLYLENETTSGWTNRFDLLLIGVRDRALDDGVDTVAPGGYTVVDFSSTVQLGEGQLTLGIGNLFNTEYVSTAGQLITNITQRPPAPGRTLSLRYSVNF
ncbi:MAG: TonB-dependent receptor [Leptolyngbya sp. SIO4C5]|nr:TonB-dependent receptor [Leptolyngbya sp. SIO4C5]